MNTLILLPGSLTLPGNIGYELSRAPYDGNGPLKAAGAIVDVHKASRRKGGGWRIIGWLTAL